MEHNSFVVSGLKAKRSEIDGELRLAERRVAQLHADLGAIDATLRIFDPIVQVRAIKPRLKRGRPPSIPSGSFSRTVLDVLREAGAPMTVREIAVKAAAVLALDMATARAMQRTIGQVRNVLARTREGLVSEKDGDVVRWRAG